MQVGYGRGGMATETRMPCKTLVTVHHGWPRRCLDTRGLGAQGRPAPDAPTPGPGHRRFLAPAIPRRAGEPSPRGRGAGAHPSTGSPSPAIPRPLRDHHEAPQGRTTAAPTPRAPGSTPPTDPRRGKGPGAGQRHQGASAHHGWPRCRLDARGLGAQGRPAPDAPTPGPGHRRFLAPADPRRAGLI
jgi:hypothetical protein